MPGDEPSRVVPGRSCGGCTLCCKILAIEELGKPHGIWCQHCKPGQGCGIYATRPAECGSFNCGYLTDPSLTDEWKPSHSKIMLVFQQQPKRIAAHVDPQRPDA